jgi:hypothetical protein
MLAALALVALCHLDASHFAGALAPEQVSDRPTAEMSRPELEAELKINDKMRMNFIGPTVMSGVGALIAVVGILFGAIGGIYAWLPTAGTAGSVLVAVGYVFLGLGTAALITGGILLIVGLVRLFPELERRKLASQRSEDLQHRLDELGGSESPESPGVPPPPPPPGAVNDGPLPGILVARF